MSETLMKKIIGLDNVLKFSDVREIFEWEYCKVNGKERRRKGILMDKIKNQREMLIFDDIERILKKQSRKTEKKMKKETKSKNGTNGIDSIRCLKEKIENKGSILTFSDIKKIMDGHSNDMDGC